MTCLSCSFYRPITVTSGETEAQTGIPNGHLGLSGFRAMRLRCHDAPRALRHYLPRRCRRVEKPLGLSRAQSKPTMVCTARDKLPITHDRERTFSGEAAPAGADPAVPRLDRDTVRHHRRA